MSGYLGVDVVNEGKYYFISYNTEDMSEVSKYVNVLASKGLPIWYDYGIQVGNDWEETIAEKIIGSEAVILFLSRNIFSKEKSFVHKEYRVSVRRKKKIFVVLLDNIAEDEIPPRYEMWWDDIMGLQCIIAPKYSVAECADKLIGEMGFVPPAKHNDECDELLKFLSIVAKEKEKLEKEREKIVAEKGNGIPLGLLKSSSSGVSEAERISHEIEKVFCLYNLDIEVSEIKQGPSYYRYYLDVKPRTSVKKVMACQPHIEYEIKRNVVMAVMDSKSRTMMIDVPKKHRTVVYLANVLESKKFADAQGEQLLFAIGEDIEGDPMVMDLCKMPHLLMAGCTGSGKSVQMNVILLSFLMKRTPEQLNLLLLDTNVIDLSVYEKVPHLIDNRVITDVRDGVTALEKMIGEMERRYELLMNAGVRNIDDYNLKVQDAPPLPKIVVAINEIGDYMMSCRKEFETAIVRLLQKSRAVGIHLILATQHPTPNVISYLIKANTPSRIAFKTATAVDSRAILDCTGAEKLIGNGDLLFYGIAMSSPARCQGAFVTEDEVEATVEYICEYYQD